MNRRRTILRLVTFSLTFLSFARLINCDFTWWDDQDPHSLFIHNLAVNPRSTSSSDTLGYVTGRDARRLVAAGRPAEARVLFDESIAWYERTLAINPLSVPTMYNLALDYQAIGQRDRGLQQMHRLVEVQPCGPAGGFNSDGPSALQFSGHPRRHRVA